LSFLVPPSDFRESHYFKPGYFGMMIVVRQPHAGSNNIKIWNVGEAVHHVFKALDEFIKNPSSQKVSDWCERFTQSIFRSIENIGAIRRSASSGRNPTGAVQDDAEISALAKSLAEAHELGSYILAIGGTVSAKTDGIEAFLKDPIAIEFSGRAAIDNAKGIAVRHSAICMMHNKLEDGLSEMQRDILKTIRESKIPIDTIARLASETRIYEPDSRFREQVAGLKRAGLIDKIGGKYTLKSSLS
jgi:hypothetical protein